jgi:hypothetical protein
MDNVKFSSFENAKAAPRIQVRNRVLEIEFVSENLEEI